MTQWTEISGSSRPHEFTKPVESKKIHSGQRFRKYAVSLCWFSGEQRRRQREREKAEGLDLEKQQLCSFITRFSTFLWRRCTTTTWKCLISRFVKDVNIRQWRSFSFPELWYSLLEFNARKIIQQLTNWTSWNKRDKVWSSANSLRVDGRPIRIKTYAVSKVSGFVWTRP